MVIDGEVVAAVTYRYVEVRGDCFQSLGQLIERARAACTDPVAAALNGKDPESRRMIDDQGLSLDEVVESGRVVRLGRRMNPPPLSGRMVDVLETLHPQLAQLAVRSARALGVRLAGVDVITTEASRPPLETGAVVLELNPRPLLRMIRHSPGPREIDRQVFEIGCPAEYRSIPVLLLDGSALAGRLLAALEAALLGKAQVVGSWCDPLATDPSMAQVRIAAEPVVWVQGEESLGAPGQLLLSDGRVEVALLNLAPERWLARGFPCSRCSAGVLMDGDGLLERGLLTEWLSVVAGPVVVINGRAALLDAVKSQVGDRLVAVADEAAALAILLTL
jgi:cyanophycin synthetase